MQTTKPTTPNPFTWRRFANVRMGDYLLGEDTVDLASLGFCGNTVTVSCPTCGEVLGNVPLELLSDGLEDITTTTSRPSSIGMKRNIIRAIPKPTIQSTGENTMNTTTAVIKPQTQTLTPGDRVAYSTQFLESIGESHGDMAKCRGIVLDREAVTDDFVLIFIDWQGRSLPQRVRESNLAKVGPNTRFCKS